MEPVAINKNRLFLWAVIITVLNPIFAGVLLGIWMARESKLRREGLIVLAFAVIWGIISFMLLSKFQNVLPPGTI